MPLRDASELMWPAVAETLAGLKDLKSEDAAAKKLAQQYAKVIDSQDGHCRGCQGGAECRRSQGSAWAMRWLGPLLLQALESLGATPAARAAMVKKGKAGDAKPSGLQRLRDARGA